MRVSPRNRPALIVPPDRETPGMSASACASPMPTPWAHGHALEVDLLPPDALRDPQHHAEGDHRRRDEPQVARHGLDLVLEQQAEHADRDRADDHQPGQPVLRLGTLLAVQQPPHPARHELGDVAGEVDEHRGLGAQLRHRGERGPRVVAEEDPGHDPQVRRRRDRQELGQALDQPQDDDFQPAHRTPSLRSVGPGGSTQRASAVTLIRSQARSCRLLADARRRRSPHCCIHVGFVPFAEINGCVRAENVTAPHGTGPSGGLRRGCCVLGRARRAAEELNTLLGCPTCSDDGWAAAGCRCRGSAWAR